MLTAALFTTANSQDEAQGLSVDEWTKKTRNTYTMVFQRVVKKNDTVSFAGEMNIPGNHSK